MELKDRITELAKAAGVATGVDPHQCWVDSKVRCPYGTPEGSFLLRPISFCNGSCKIYADAGSDLYRPDETTVLNTYFNDKHVTIASELRARADEVPEHSLERHTLLLAAEVIEDKKLDRDILLREDLPE